MTLDPMIATNVDDPDRVFTIAPSDLTFLLNDCVRCFYLKVVEGTRRPSGPMPGVFTVMDRCQREHFEGKPTTEVEGNLAPGTFRTAELKVMSKPLKFGAKTSIQFRGTIDAMIEFDDGTFGLVDFKTTAPKESLVAFYGLQLHAYALALEQPAPLKPAFAPIVRLGLLCFNPVRMVKSGARRYAFETSSTWLDVPREDAAFRALMGTVAEILEWPHPPQADPSCRSCQRAA